jgi:hypothetical protein
VSRSSIAAASVQVVEVTVTVRIRRVEPLLRDTGGRLMRQWRPANELANIGFSAAVSASVSACECFDRFHSSGQKPHGASSMRSGASSLSGTSVRDDSG